MFRNKIIFFFFLLLFTQGYLCVQIEAKEAREEGIAAEAMNEDEMSDQDQMLSEEEMNAQEGNSGYIYGSPSIEEDHSEKPKRESLWQRIKKLDKQFQEKFW